MKSICLEDQYYSDFVQRKASQPLVVVNWSQLGEVFSLLEGSTFSEFANITAGILVVSAMVVAVGLLY